MSTQHDELYLKIEGLVQYLGHLELLQSKCCSLSMVQASVISAIGRSTDLSIITLAEQLILDKSTVSRHVSNLVNEGYVNRVESSEDRRYSVLSLTEKGQQVYQTIQNTTRHYYTQIFSKMSQEDQEKLKSGLSALLDVMKDRV